MSGNLTPYHTYEEGSALPTVNPTGTHSSADQLAMSSKLVGGKRENPVVQKANQEKEKQSLINVRLVKTNLIAKKNRRVFFHNTVYSIMKF